MYFRPFLKALACCCLSLTASASAMAQTADADPRMQMLFVGVDPAAGMRNGFFDEQMAARVGSSLGDWQMKGGGRGNDDGIG